MARRTDSKKWLVRVFENGLHAYNEFFRTRAEALRFSDRVTAQHIKWSVELVNLSDLKEIQ